MDIRAEMALRLTRERTRLGLAQADVARMVGVSREGLRLYEQGQRGLSAEFLAATAAIGFDVQFILTGVESQNRAAVERAAGSAVNITGGSVNLLQNAHAGAQVTFVATQRHVTNTKVQVSPGEDHISESQAAKLSALVENIVNLEAKLKKKPTSYRGVWGALNAHCGVTRYRLIPLVDYEKAEKYLRQWIGRLSSMPSAIVSDNIAWRNRKIAYIKINTADSPDWLPTYLRKKFRATSLVDINDDDIEVTYKAVSARKKALGKKAKL